MVADRQEPDEFSQEETIIVDNGTGVEVEDIGGEERITEPFDPSLIRVNTRPMTIDLLRSRIEHQELDLAPDFQRKGGIWKADAQSRLIESMLIRIPLPAFYMDATNDEKWLVVDGLQRLTTIKKFMIDKTLRLSGLEFLIQIAGKSFDELPRNYQRRIAETQVTVYLIDKGTPDEVKFNIFKRINTGGLPLSTQEIRNALYQGEATKMLVRLADSDAFKRAVNYSIKDDRMADREFVLRYLAFTITPYMKYDGDFDRFLNKTMEDINKMPHRDREELEKKFIRSMNIARDIFGQNAFRKLGGRPVNKPLFEAWSVNFNQLSDEQARKLVDRKELVVGKYRLLEGGSMNFYESITFATGNARKVRVRFEAIANIIKEVLL